MSDRSVGRHRAQRPLTAKTFLCGARSPSKPAAHLSAVPLRKSDLATVRTALGVCALTVLCRKLQPTSLEALA